MLSDSGDCLIIDVWRQVSPVNSPGSSPTPVIHSVMPHLSEQVLVTSPVISPDKVDMRRPLWTPDTSEDSKNSNKNLKTSGSQTDSLDSPGTTPKHSRNNKIHNAKDYESKSKVHILDLAKDKFIDKFLSRHKSHDSTENDKNQKTRNSMVPDNPILDDITNKSSMQRAGQKRELESENSGTWPKCVRVNHTPNGTVIVPSPGRRKRPSIDAMINGPYDPSPGLVTGHRPAPCPGPVPSSKVLPPRSVDTFQHKIPETFQHGHSSPTPNKSSKSTPYLSHHFRPTTTPHHNTRNPTSRIVSNTNSSPPHMTRYEQPNSRQNRSSHQTSQQNFTPDSHRPMSLEVKSHNMLPPSYSNDSRDILTLRQQQFYGSPPTRSIKIPPSSPLR